MGQKNYITPLFLDFLEAADLTAGAWLPFEVNGIEGPCFTLRVTNDSEINVLLSYDGITAHEFLADYTKIDVLFQTNASPSGDVSKVKTGTVIYLKSELNAKLPPPAGYIYLAGYYN